MDQQGLVCGQKQYRKRRWLVCTVLLMAAGCGSSATPAKGRVTLDGQPLDEAIVIFIPLQAGRKKTGAAINKGTYILAMQNGLTPGEYRVEIVDNPPLNTPGLHGPEGAATLAKRRLLPYRYANDSPLTIEVPSSPTEYNFDFELTSLPSN
jgi:hypothetical protein